MPVVENKEKVRRWFEETVRGGTDEPTLRAVAAQTISPRFVAHDGPDPAHGYDAMLRALPGLLRAFPDLRFTIEQLIGEGDLVAVRLRGEATHSGEAMGRSPTGKRITWTENEIFRFADGLVVESWGEGTLDEALGRDRLRLPVGAARGVTPRPPRPAAPNARGHRPSGMAGAIRSRTCLAPNRFPTIRGSTN